MNSHHHQPLNHPKTCPPLDAVASNSPFDMLRGSASTSISGLIFGDPAGVCDKKCYQITDSFKFQVVEVLLEGWEAHKFLSNMCNDHQRSCMSPHVTNLGPFSTPALGGEAIFALGEAWGVALGERSPTFTASALCFRRSFLESFEACEVTQYWSPKSRKSSTYMIYPSIWITPKSCSEGPFQKGHTLWLLGPQPPTRLPGQPFLLLQEPSWHLVLLVLALVIFHSNKLYWRWKRETNCIPSHMNSKKSALSLSRLISRWTSETALSLSPSDVVVTSDFAVAFCMTLLTFQGCDLDFCPQRHTKNSQETVQNRETYQYTIDYSTRICSSTTSID